MADAARAAILPWFRSTALVSDNKLDDGFDPVTEADRAAETAMRAVLADRRPDDGIHGEEFGRQPGTSGLTWVLDPIDGTRAFISGSPTWGVLIAVGGAGGPDLGIIDQPYIGERFVGGFGLGEMTDTDPVAMYLNDVFTVPASMAGLPAISVPAGLDGDGLPMGLHLIAKPFDEETLFRAAWALENAAGFDTKPPSGAGGAT